MLYKWIFPSLKLAINREPNRHHETDRLTLRLGRSMISPLPGKSFSALRDDISRIEAEIARRFPAATAASLGSTGMQFPYPGTGNFIGNFPINPSTNIFANAPINPPGNKMGGP